MRRRHQSDFVFCKQVQLGDAALRYQTNELVCPFHSVERLDDKTSWIAHAVAELGKEKDRRGQATTCSDPTFLMFRTNAVASLVTVREKEEEDEEGCR